MEAEGAIPRIKERRNIIFTGKDFFVGSVTSTRQFVLHTAMGVLSHQLRNDAVIEKVFIFRAVGPGSLS